MRENFSNRIAYVDGTLATSGDGLTAKNAVSLNFTDEISETVYFSIF